MQNEITNKGKLLNENGALRECGYAKSLILDYNRKDIKANKMRIKEWDYYLIYDEKFALALTVDDNGYMGLMSASVIDFDNKSETTKSIMTLFPFGKTNLPSSSKIGDSIFENKKVSFKFLNDGKTRKITTLYNNFNSKQNLEVDITLTEEPIDSMVIATPFKEKKTAFYYNQKIVGFKAQGYFKLGEKKYTLSPTAQGLLDWGRGVWTYKNTWYWGSGCGYVSGKKFGFNIGYGFGDTSNASENMLFYEGKAHKLDQVSFNIPKDKNGKDDFLSPWTFTSNDNRFNMDFVPIIDRKSYTSALIISSDQHQVFGKFSGTAILDDGTKITLKDFIGFAEKVRNKW